jgi:hypothetical protein
MLIIWLRAALAQLLHTLERFAKDVLPRDMGGTGVLLYMTGEEATPEGVWAEHPLRMDLAADNYLCESDLSSMKRLLRRTPRAFAQWVLGPMLCVRNGVFEELSRDHALADAVWSGLSKKHQIPRSHMADAWRKWIREQTSGSRSCKSSMQPSRRGELPTGSPSPADIRSPCRIDRRGHGGHESARR